MDVLIREGLEGLQEAALVELYESVGWAAYTKDPEGLVRAIQNSTCVLSAWHQARLVGLARALSDEVSILYVQDILVTPTLQGQGLGTMLLERLLETYAHVRQKVLLTDDRPEQHAFYAKHGYKDVSTLRTHRLHAFARIEGVELE